MFVGGIRWAEDDASLKKLFEDGDAESGTEGCGSGTVEEAMVAKSRETGRSRGFAFVTMTSLEKAIEAVNKFNNLEYKGRTLTVDEAVDQGNRRTEEGGGYTRRSGNHSRGFSDSSF